MNEDDKQKLRQIINNLGYIQNYLNSAFALSDLEQQMWRVCEMKAQMSDTLNQHYHLVEILKHRIANVD